MKITNQTDIFDVGWTRRLMEDLFASRDPEFGGGTPPTRRLLSPLFNQFLRRYSS